MRYIDAEPLEKFIENGLNRKENPFGWQAIEILTQIHYAPTEDVEPMRHAYWMKRKNHLFGRMEYACSICYPLHGIYEIDWSRYCPNCGAKMDEEENEK